ncbi:unnamed protein product [Caenorhabditis auriculariae]|uniref:Uncharacterized protein n=1 Tax=Caenorhabditis auriculariae TaxID=2777116 RepID=A0A8S1HSS8_9PELO|nr:unnamed protein product [Caenorhabditis auriculariae]
MFALGYAIQDLWTDVSYCAIIDIARNIAARESERANWPKPDPISFVINNALELIGYGCQGVDTSEKIDGILKNLSNEHETENLYTENPID